MDFVLREVSPEMQDSRNDLPYILNGHVPRRSNIDKLAESAGEKVRCEYCSSDLCIKIFYIRHLVEKESKIKRICGEPTAN